ncbi:hypothetical protein ABBQ32_008464 [Trebouxia sp. C0010 RCD-2024]
MVDVQTKLTDLREEAYAKVLKCLPYPRQWATERLITGLRAEFGIVDDVHEEILEAVMSNTERPRKRQKYASSQPLPYEQSSAQLKRAHNHTSYFEPEQPSSTAGPGEPAGHPRNSLTDKVQQAKQKVKAQGSSNLGPSSRLAAAVAGPVKAKKRKERMEAAALTYKQPQSAQPQIRQLTEDEIAQGCKLDPCIGMRVQRLWPEDGGWFEGVVTDYSALDSTHCITYNFNTNDESFEWYDLRNRNPDECKVLKGKVDVLSKGVQHQQQQPPLSAQPNNASFHAPKPARKPGQGFGRGSKKGPGRHSAGGGRGGHSQRVAPNHPPHVSHQPPTAHKFQVVSSDDDDYGAGGSDEDVSDDGDYGL